MTKTDLIKWAGSASKLARALDISPASVSEWPENGVPMSRQYQVERMTGGKLQASAWPTKRRQNTLLVAAIDGIERTTKSLRDQL